MKRDKGIPRDRAGSPYTLGAVQIISMDLLNPPRLYAATNRTHAVFASDDGGATWVRFNKGFPAQTNVYAVAANPHRGGEPAAVAFSSTTGTRYFTFDGVGRQFQTPSLKAFRSISIPQILLSFTLPTRTIEAWIAVSPGMILPQAWSIRIPSGCLSMRQLRIGSMLQRILTRICRGKEF